MEKKCLLTIVALGLVCAIGLVPSVVAHAQDNVEFMRDRGIDENNTAPGIVKQKTDKGRFIRNYRQQPPLIPHRIDQYEIDKKVNQCMRCHDWPYNVTENAPKISETHYTNREGQALDHIARTRWFCTQCHVSQLRASPLVSNTFRSALEVE